MTLVVTSTKLLNHELEGSFIEQYPFLSAFDYKEPVEGAPWFVGGTIDVPFIADLFHLIQKAGEIPLQLTRGMWYDEEYAVVEICDDYRE